tara:strand:+ start:83 stop:442 length:360 start_codon:yes stop_codon:yes gene_type:complete
MGALSPKYSGAWDVVYNADVDESEDQVTNGPAHLGGWALTSTDESELYVHFYDALVAGITVGTTVPRITVFLPVNSGSTFSIDGGIFFETAIAIAATTTLSGSSGPGAADCSASVFVNG